MIITHAKVLAVTVGGLILAGACLRVAGLVDHASRSCEPDDPAVEVMSRIRRELAGAAVALADKSDDLPAGHLVYEEGARADATDRSSHTSRNISSGGDTDDVLTMTVRADPASSFTVVAPWGVLEAARAVALGADYTLPDGFDPQAPRSVTSRHAEVAYWMAPAVVGEDATTRLRLHRRMRLIRPDLNVTSLELAASGRKQQGFSGLPPNQPMLGYLRDDGVVQPYRDWLATVESGNSTTRETRLPIASGEGLSETLVIAADIVAFDVQVLDPEAPIFIGVGDDGMPGTAGVDDDGNGIIDHLSTRSVKTDRGEFGAMGSDDPMITPSDPAFAYLVRDHESASVLIARGVFVDHGYAIQSGGNVRLGIEFPDVGGVRQQYFSLLSSPYSGASVQGTTAKPQITVAPKTGSASPARGLSIGREDGSRSPVTLRVVVRYRSAATGNVHQIEAIEEF